MRNRLLVLAVAIISFFPRPVGAQGAAPWMGSSRNNQSVAAATTVADYTGRVVVSREGTRKPMKLKAAPFALEAGDVVRTADDGSATLLFPDGTKVRLEARSAFTLAEESPSLVSLSLSAGKLWAWVSKNRTRSFEVRTPSSVAAVRGTSFSVEALGARGSLTEVYEGAVAVQALKDGLPSGREALLLSGQNVQAAAGALSSVRTIVKPASSPAKQPAAKNKAALEKKLQRMAASKDADKAAAAQKALASGDAAKMRAAAEALGGAQAMSKEQKTLLNGAFQNGRPLAALVSDEAGRQPKITLPSPAAAKWNVNREVGLQLHQQMSASMIAHGAISPSASPASAQVTMAAYQQQYTQSYIAGQQPASTTAGAVRTAPPSVPTMTPAQMSAQTAASLQPPTSPTSPVYRTSPTQTAPVMTAPTMGTGTCSCSTTGCVCN